MSIVTHYGIHRTSHDVVYLHQGRGSTNFIGLSELSPFEVRTSEARQRACPHVINASTPMPDREHWKTFMEIYNDPLVQEFLPLPRRNSDPIPLVSGVDDMLLVLLSKLSSPIYPIIYRFGALTQKAFQEQMTLTNVTPLVFSQGLPENQREMEELANVGVRSPRKLIFAGDPHMVARAPIQRIHSYLNHMDMKILYSLPMEQLGAVVLRRWARGEQPDSPWDRYGN